jgi:hypothetical protein
MSSTFQEGRALGLSGFGKPNEVADTFAVTWGVPFLLFGNYMLWGRFILDAWLKRRTFYPVTNRRVLIVRRSFSFKTFSVFPSELSTTEREGATLGTLWLGRKYPIIGPRGQNKRT